MESTTGPPGSGSASRGTTSADNGGARPVSTPTGAVFAPARVPLAPSPGHTPMSAPAPVRDTGPGTWPGPGRGAAALDGTAAGRGNARGRRDAAPAAVASARGRPPPRVGASAQLVRPSATYADATQDSAVDVVRLLVTQLAPLLGLDGAQVAIGVTVDDEAPRGAASAHRIDVTGDLAHRRLRGVVAHELVHVRQHENRGIAKADTTAAEAEAAGIASAVATGRDVWVPRAALPDGRIARDGDATGIAEAPKPEAAQTVETATTDDVVALELRLDESVKTNHSGDVREIEGLLDHPWTQNTSSMVENALRILSGFPFVIARAIVRRLDAKVRRKLAQLEDDHHQAYPEACIAVLSALTATELTGLADTDVGPNSRGYPGAAAALRNVQPERLTPVARRALLAVLRRVGKKTLAKLVDGERREVFRALLESPPDAATDVAELNHALAAEAARSSDAKGSEELQATVRTLVREGGRENAQKALTKLAPLCGVATPVAEPASTTTPAPPTAPPTLDDLRAAMKKPPAAGAGSNAPPETTPKLRGVVNALDAVGLIGKLVESLDEDDRRHPGYGKVLRVVLAARSAAANLSRAVELLSYGLFDWAVRDHEARLAYLLVRSTPVESQDAWRQLDNGKWFARLLDNLPGDMWDSGEYTGVGSEYATSGPALGVSEALLIGYAKTIRERWENQSHRVQAKWLVRELLGLKPDGTPRPWILDDADKDLALRTAVIRRLDALQGLNDMIEELPDDYLLGEQTRQELLDLNQLRDPIHLVRQALGLMPGFFALLTFTPHDAWIALQALRALSPGAQQAFAVQNPTVWTTFWEALTAEMRRALPSTLATGRDARLPTKAQLRERLSDERLWTEANAPTLRALVNLAVAADDRWWLFELSRRLRADLRLAEAPRLAQLLRDFGLYNEAEKRTAFDPKKTDTSHSPKGARLLGTILKGLVLGGYHLLSSDARFSLMGKTIRIQAFDLSELQWVLGGDITPGVTLASDPDKLLGGAPAGANQIDVAATFAAGFLVHLDVPTVDIAGVNMVMPGKTYKAGPVKIKGFRVSAGFSDRGYTRPGYVAAKFDALTMRDFVIVDPRLPLSGAWAVSDLDVHRFGFNATPDASTNASDNFDRKLPEGTIPIPVFGPLFQLLANLVSLNGSIPGDFTLLDYAMIPLKIPQPLSFGVSRVANKVLPTPQPLTHLWGLASDGVLRPPYSAAQRIKDSTAMLRAFNVAFDRLEVEGVSIGSGQQIGSIVLENVNVTVGQSLPAYLNAALAMVTKARLNAKPGTPQHEELVRREEALKTQLAAAWGDKAKDEKRLQELEGKDRWHPGSLSDDERAELVRLTKQLRSDVGVVAEIGSITLGPLSGAIQSPGVTLKGLHARAKLPNVGILPYAPGYLDDKSLIDQFTAGGPSVPTIGKLATSSEFSLVIDETKLTSTDPTQPAVILKADKIPSVQSLRKELAALPEIEGNRPIRERLRFALDTVIALELAQKQVTDAATDAARMAAAQRVRELTDLAKRLLGTEIGGITFGRITGELDPQGALAISLHDVVATGIAGRGFAIDRAEGTLSAGLSAGNVDARIDQVAGVSPGTLVTQLKPTIGLSGLDVTGIHLPSGSIGRVTLGKLSGSLEATKTGYRVPDLTIDHLEVAQVAMGSPGDGITADSVIIDGLAMTVEVTVSREPGGASAVTAATIPRLSITTLRGAAIVMDSPQEDGSTTHVAVTGGTLHDIRGKGIVFEPGSDGWALVRASATVDRFEDVGFQLAMGALKSRKTVEGTVTTDAKRSGAPTITASYVKDKSGRSVSLSVRDLLARGTDVTTADGSLTVRQVKIAEADYLSNAKETRATAHLTGLVLGPIRWQIGTAVLSGPGPVTAASVTLAAELTPEIAATEKTKKIPAAWSVTDIVITNVTGKGLKWTDKPIELELGRSDRAGTGEPPLTIGRIHLKPAAGKYQLSSLSVDLQGKVTDTLGVKGSLRADVISVEVRKGDRIHSVLRGISGSASLSGAYAGVVDLSGLRGAIDVGPDAIRFGSDDPADTSGLFVEQLTARSLDITTELAGKKVHLTTATPGSTTPGGRVDFLGIRTNARIDKRKPREKGKSDLKTLAFESFSIERVVLDALKVDLPDDDITITIPAAAAKTDETYLRDVQLVSPIGTDPTKLHPDFTIDLDTLKAEGSVSIAEVSARVSARIKDKFSGDVRLTTGLSQFHLFAGGGFGVDITKPLVTMDKAATLGKDKTVIFSKLGAAKVSMREGVVHVEKPFVGDLEYVQMKHGVKAVWIRVKSVDISELTYDTKGAGSLSIPSLDITDAYFSVSLAALSNGPPAPQGIPTEAEVRAAAAATFDPKTIRPIMSELDGWIGAELFVATDIGGLKDIHVGKTDDLLFVPIKKGEIDIPTFESQLEGAVEARVLGGMIGPNWTGRDVALRPWVVDAVAEDPLLAIHGNQLRLGVYIINPDFAKLGLRKDVETRPETKLWNTILAWDLRPVDLDRAWNNKFALWSAIFDLHSDPPTTKEMVDAMSEDDRKKFMADRAAKQATLDSLEIRTLKGAMSIKNQAPIPLKISSEAAKGTVMVSKDAVMGLTFEGGIPAVDPAPGRGGSNLGKLAYGLKGFSLDSIDLTLYEQGSSADPKTITGLSGLKTGKISVSGLKEGSLTFANLFYPLRLSGTISNAHAENITWFSYGKSPTK